MKYFKKIAEEDNHFITKEYLIHNPNHIFVFGDNLLRKGMGGAAKLRNMFNTYGFITKKEPNNNIKSFYTLDEYKTVYKNEINKLKNKIKNNSNNLFIISKLGSGLANRYKIFEKIIEPNIKKDLKEFQNVKFLW